MPSSRMSTDVVEPIPIVLPCLLCGRSTDSIGIYRLNWRPPARGQVFLYGACSNCLTDEDAALRTGRKLWAHACVELGNPAAN
jgi:hypothetical protein